MLLQVVRDGSLIAEVSLDSKVLILELVNTCLKPVIVLRELLVAIGEEFKSMATRVNLLCSLYLSDDSQELRFSLLLRSPLQLHFIQVSHHLD